MCIAKVLAIEQTLQAPEDCSTELLWTSSSCSGRSLLVQIECGISPIINGQTVAVRKQEIAVTNTLISVLVLWCYTEVGVTVTRSIESMSPWFGVTQL